MSVYKMIPRSDIYIPGWKVNRCEGDSSLEENEN